MLKYSSLRGFRRLLLLISGIFFLSGFSALLYQVVWQRILSLFSGGDVYSVTIIVAAFMGGLGIGNLVGGHVADRLSRKHNLFMFVVGQLAIAVFAILSKIFFYDILYLRFTVISKFSSSYLYDPHPPVSVK